MQTKSNLLRWLKSALAVILLLISITACTSSADTNQATTSSSGNTSAAKSNQAASSSAITPTTARGAQGKHSAMENASPEEVGRIALAASSRWKIPGGSAEVVLARRATLDEVSGLGLGCYNFASIETPPLMLVVLKGDFNVTGMMPDALPPGTKQMVKYIVYVYDLWAGQPTVVITSDDGSGLGKVLNDATMPNNGLGQSSSAQPACQAGATSGKTIHYGDVAPAAFTPTWDNQVPTPIWATETPSPPTPTALPAPIGTDTAP